MQKMEQTTLHKFFLVRKHSGPGLGRKRKRTESSIGVSSSSFSKSCSKAEDKMVCHGEKKVVTPTSASSPLRAGSRGMAMLRLAQEKAKAPGHSVHLSPASDSKPQAQQPSSESESPRLQRFRSVEFVSPKKR